MKRSSQHLENLEVLEAPQRPLPWSLLLDVLAVMKEAYKPFPKELWGLSRRATDMLAPRGFVIDEDDSLCRYYLRAGADRPYPIAEVRTVDRFNRPISIHPGVPSIEFGAAFNFPVLIPAGVTELAFGMIDTSGSVFNHPLRLPASIRKLQLEYRFDQPITLPPLLRHLIVGHDFNQLLSLTPRLVSLGFVAEGNFNQPLELPNFLRYLYLGDKFNQPLSLPYRLRKLRLGADFNQPLDLPRSLRELFFRESDAHNRLSMQYPLSLPKFLRKLVLWCDSPIIHMTEALRSLEIGPYYSCPIKLCKGLRELTWLPNRSVSIPAGVEKVVFGGSFQQPVVLPPGLQSVTFKGEYNLPLELPDGCVRVDP